MKSKKPTKVTREKNFRSRYERNRTCWRKDETTYVYLDFVECPDGECRYIEREIHVGDTDVHGNVVTIEILDFLFGCDNAEAQDTEDADDYATEINISGEVFMGATYNSPEEELFSEEEQESPLVQEFMEKVEPKLSEEQKNLIYDRFGARKTLEELAHEQDKPVSKQAIDNRIKKIYKKVKDNMDA